MSCTNSNSPGQIEEQIQTTLVYRVWRARHQIQDTSLQAAITANIGDIMNTPLSAHIAEAMRRGEEVSLCWIC